METKRNKPGRVGTEMERFWRKVLILENGCWFWTGGKDNQGYGFFALEAKPRKGIGAHVYAYTRSVGPVPEGLELDHKCRNPSCVNPLHLEPVTTRVNVLRGFGACAINVRKTHCIHGHPFSGENLYLRPDGGRACRTCQQTARQVRRMAYGV